MAEKEPGREGLAGTGAAAQPEVEAWAALREQLLEVEELPDGRVLRFPGGLADEVRALALREVERCPFLRIGVHEEPERTQVAVEITSDEPEAMSVIRSLAGEAD